MKIKEWTIWTAGLIVFFCIIISIIYMAEKSALEPNQNIREKLFFQCLEKIPEGPRSTHYNDWAEVVDRCGSQAYYLSLRHPKGVDKSINND